jgi:molecular chaperone Hsp33
LQSNFSEINTSISKLIFDGVPLVEILDPLMKGISFTEIPHDFPLKYACPCTADRVKRALTTLGLVDLQEMIDGSETPEITCQVCGRKYTIQVQELKDLLDELKRNQLH